MKAYKVFNPDWTCRGFQFAVGEVYEEAVAPKLCSAGFHACVKLVDCFGYYTFDPSNKVAEVELLGDIDSQEDSDKVCSNKIAIVREISWFEVLEMVNLGKGNTGNRNTGDWNTGNRNTGNQNTGGWNTVDCETGFFNTTDSGVINIFNKPCKKDVWGCAIKPSWLYFNLAEWVSTEDMSEEDKEKHPEHETTGGYLKKLDYKEAFLASFLKADKKDQALVRKLPNFDEDVFFEISGIRLSDYGV